MGTLESRPLVTALHRSMDAQGGAPKFLPKVERPAFSTRFDHWLKWKGQCSPLWHVVNMQ